METDCNFKKIEPIFRDNVEKQPKYANALFSFKQIHLMSFLQRLSLENNDWVFQLSFY